MADVNFSARAYCKILLHAIKYPYCAINGLLLAKSKNKSDAKTNELQIVDCIPLFHICLHISPMSEVALTMIDQYASRKGLVIAGYYLANENMNDMSTDKPAHRTMSEKIAENFGQALLVVINNKEMNYNMDINPLRVSQHADGKWKSKDKADINFEGGKTLFETMSCLMKEEDCKTLVDFDNHLDNIALDWQNLKLNDRIEEVMGNNQ
ncbi:ER membrane protein complex subunit 8/9 homolog [Leptopilina heterotoma]|uniref:ER membrane protein complex subunit 8/9 homolog n=1 Tax=Leptopilina heterotoma TaxID=63436 RepID=UPI001CA9A2E8|nr:ER membrane protein complex subunit 8/9 homolog [Leptopilina heterotoma]